jgi:predicted DCC family thiol-disulfide oxidoreductase YuxK
MEAPEPATAPIPDRLLLFDGVCGMCNQFVQVMLDLDKSGAFTYAPLQGETAARLRSLHPEIPETLDTIVYLEGGQVFLYSSALLNASRHLPGILSVGPVFLWIPRPIRDLIYKFVAVNRYRVWGTVESCRIPEPGQMERFLD